MKKSFIGLVDFVEHNPKSAIVPSIAVALIVILISVVLSHRVVQLMINQEVQKNQTATVTEVITNYVVVTEVITNKIITIDHFVRITNDFKAKELQKESDSNKKGAEKLFFKDFRKKI